MDYRNSVTFCVYGNYALFSDPITRVGGEKFSYQVPTYEALKGILQSVYWKPTFIWIIDEVRIMNPIQTESKGMRPIKYSSNGNDLSYYTYLKDVKYQVKAHFVWNENRPELECDRNENKHHNIAKRSIMKGGRRAIFLGTSECGGYVEPCEFGEGEGFYDNIPELDFGLMYHGITYPDEATKKEQEWFDEQKDVPRIKTSEQKGGISVRLWHCVMKKGVIHFAQPEECIHKPIREAVIKPFGKKNTENVDVTYKNVMEGETDHGTL